MNPQNVEQGFIGINNIGGETLAPALSVADAFNGDGFHQDQPVIPTISAVAGLQNTDTDPGYAYSITAHDLNDGGWADNSNFLSNATGEMWGLDINSGIVGFGGKPVKAFLANGTTPFPDVGGGDDLYTPAIANKNFAYQPSQSNSVPLIANQGNESYNANDVALEVGTNFRAIKGVSIADLSDPNGEAVMKNVANGYDLGTAGLANSGATIISDPWAALWQDTRAWGGTAVSSATDITASTLDFSSSISAPIVGSLMLGHKSDDFYAAVAPIIDYMSDGSYRAMEVSLVGYNKVPVGPTNPIDTAPGFQFINSQFDTTGDGNTLDMTLHPKKDFTFSVISDNSTASAWTVEFQGDPGNGRYKTVATHTQATNGENGIISLPNTPLVAIKIVCTALTLGSANNILATVLAL